MGNSSICVLHCPDLGGGRGTLMAAPLDGRPHMPYVFVHRGRVGVGGTEGHLEIN